METEEKIADFWANDIVNHPAVYPTVNAGHPYPMDISSLAERPGAIFLRYKHGGFMLDPKGSGIYEGHVFFTPEGWGFHAVKSGRDVLRKAFTVYGASAVYANTEKGSRAGRYCEAIGMDWNGKRYIKWA